MILVTGGTGLLGNCVIRELLSRGIPVRALCRRGTTRESFSDLDVEIIEGHLGQADRLQEAARGCQSVVHSAAMLHIGWRRLEESRRVNVDGTRNVIEACLANDIPLIHISTVDTLPAAISIDRPVREEHSLGIAKTACDYVISKREAEDVVRCAIREQQLRAQIIHPGFMLGPYDWKPSSGRLMLGVLKAPVAIAPSGGCSLCDPRDVAAGVANALDQGESGQAYIMAGENLTYRELWTRILRVAGKSKRVSSPTMLLRLTGSLADCTFKLLPKLEGDINGASIAMGQLNHFYDSAKAQQKLDYRNRPWETTLRDAWEWLQQRFC